MPAEQPAVLRQALIGQERFRAHVFGQRKDQRTTTGISLHGVALDGQLALSESPVRLLEAGEPLPAGMKLAEPVCSVSGLTAGAPETAGAVLAASGDQVHWLCRGGHLEALEHTVKQAEGGSAGSIEGVVAPSYESTGSRKILVMMVDFSDYPGGAVSLADAQAALNDVTTFIRANAFNQLSFTTKQVTPVLRMPRTASSYVSLDDPYSLLADARIAAAAAGFNQPIMISTRLPSPGSASVGVGSVTSVEGQLGTGRLESRGFGARARPQLRQLAREFLGLQHDRRQRWNPCGIWQPLRCAGQRL
jgi:hypothetical protein